MLTRLNCGTILGVKLVFFLVPRLCLGMPVARLCLDYDSEMNPVCGQSLGTRTIATFVSRSRQRHRVPGRGGPACPPKADTWVCLYNWFPRMGHDGMYGRV